MLRFTGNRARRTLPGTVLGLRAASQHGRRRYSGLRAQLERERRAKQLRRGKRVRLTGREKWVAVLLLLLILLACAVGGWLGMHFHHHESALRHAFLLRDNAL